ncbi:hypothetical protein Bhyg_10189, partial [Pseudolycoriella hygida]
MVVKNVITMDRAVIELYNGLISLRHSIRYVCTTQIWIASDHDRLV